MEGFGEKLFPVTIVQPAEYGPALTVQVLILMAIRYAQVMGYAFFIALGVLLAFRVLG